MNSPYKTEAVARLAAAEEDLKRATERVEVLRELVASMESKKKKKEPPAPPAP